MQPCAWLCVGVCFSAAAGTVTTNTTRAQSRTSSGSDIRYFYPVFIVIAFLYSQLSLECTHWWATSSTTTLWAPREPSPTQRASTVRITSFQLHLHLFISEDDSETNTEHDQSLHFDLISPYLTLGFNLFTADETKSNTFMKPINMFIFLKVRLHHNKNCFGLI